MATYGQFFDWLYKRCNFKGKGAKASWTCYHDLRFTKEFCSRHGLDFNKVEKELSNTGGYCDCEVILNSSDKIPDSKQMPRVGFRMRGIDFSKPF
jgi:hypothetical protein